MPLPAFGSFHLFPPLHAMSAQAQPRDEEAAEAEPAQEAEPRLDAQDAFLWTRDGAVPESAYDYTEMDIDLIEGAEAEPRLDAELARRGVRIPGEYYIPQGAPIPFGVPLRRGIPANWGQLESGPQIPREWLLLIRVPWGGDWMMLHSEASGIWLKRP